MNEAARLLLMLAIAGAGMTFLGSAALWFMDEERRIRRALTRVLKGPPDSMLVARGRGKGAGFAFGTGLAAVAWDLGRWCLVYRIDELVGAELLIDGQVSARVFRGEPRRPLDRVVGSAAQVTLRLVFDDPQNPDFDLDLWLAGDEHRREARSPADAVQQANSWLARAEAILRRPVAPRGPTPVAPVVRQEPPPRPPPEPEPEHDDDGPPWDEDGDERDN